MAAGLSGEIKAEVSQCLFEFLHMQVVAYFQEACGKDKNVDTLSELSEFLASILDFNLDAGRRY